MNFYRRVFAKNTSNNDYIVELNDDLYPTLSSFGFVDYNTNEPIYKKISDFNSNNPTIYWEKDTLKKTTINRYSNGFSSWFNYFININGDSNAGGIYGSTFMPSVAYKTIIFIPVKGGGFLLNVISCNDFSYVNDNFMTPRIKIRGKAEDFLKRYDDNYVNSAYSDLYHITFIGLPPTYKSALDYYCYIIDTARFDRDGISTNDPIKLTNTFNNSSVWVAQKNVGDYKKVLNNVNNPSEYENITLRVQNPSTFHDLYFKQAGKGMDYPKMDFNPNVCVLTKYPYDNGFIDNLYMMTTCPNSYEQGQTTQGDFFSFNGRNFINMFGNMVIELPGY